MLIKKIIKLLHIVPSPIWWRGLLLGVAASTEHIPVLRNISANTVVDIGANKGQFSLACLKFYPSATIYAFEPQLKPFTRFQGLFSGKKNVTVFKNAISDQSSEVDMYVSISDDCSSLLPITNNQSSFFSGTGFSHRESIQLAPLSTLINDNDLVSPVLMKIDVQGSELSVLKGSSDLLHLVDHIYVECSFIELYEGQALASEVIGYLHDRGFSLQGVYNICYDNKGIAIQADFLFARSMA